MDVSTIHFLFWFLVFALISIMLICSHLAKKKMLKELMPQYRFRSKAERQRDREVLADMKRTRLAIIDALDISKPYVAPTYDNLPENDDWLSKFDSSKVKRRQRPTSRATPMVKSKRGRK